VGVRPTLSGRFQPIADGEIARRMDDEPRTYRRYLPHWRVDGAIYFVTWRLHPGQCALTAVERDQVAQSLHYFNGHRYRLFAYVVMDDHVHVVVRPLPGFELERIVQAWKSYSAVCMQRGRRRRRVWQRECFDRIIRDAEELANRIDYVLGNPALRWPGVEQYPWTWCRRDPME
jgi:REP element-mobilizing transposase RayT